MRVTTITGEKDDETMQEMQGAAGGVFIQDDSGEAVWNKTVG